MAENPDYIDCYYSRTLAEDIQRPELHENIEMEVCIIGGGLAGLATALGLLERGKKVVVLESQRVGFGASGRNGGFVLAGYAADEKKIIKKVGLPRARELYGLTQDAMSLIRKRIKDFNISCDPVDGHMVASWYDQPDVMKREVDFLAGTFDEKVEFWPREKVQEVCTTEQYHEGMFFPDYFHMHPLNYLRALADAIEAKGGKIYEGTCATKIDDSTDVKRVHTAKGIIRADHVVYCGSAYFNGIEKRLSRSCLPVSTYVMVTEPVPQEKLDKAIRKPYAIRDNRWADDYYRVLPDNSILWGGRVGLNKNPENLDTLLLGDLLKIYPQLEGIKPRVTWQGLMGYTVHEMPHIGQLKPGIWTCTNFGGNGVGPTTAGGEIIASAIAEGNERYKLFAPFGFTYTGGPLGPLVAQAAYKSWEIGDWLKERREDFRVKQRKAG